MRLGFPGSRQFGFVANMVAEPKWALVLLLAILWCIPVLTEAEVVGEVASKQAEQDFARGQRWYWGKDSRKDYTQAYIWFEKAAVNGHSRALAMVADMCVTGLGVPFNVDKGFFYAQRAANQHDVFGTYLLGKYYFWGWGTDQDGEQGEKIFSQVLTDLEEAAEHGDQLAQFGLGWIYYHLSDETKDYQKAYEWYKKSAASGYSVAENNLGVLYGNGHGVRENVRQELFWYRQAAKQGYAQSQMNLAYELRDAGDLSGQFRWTRIAAEQQFPHGLYRMGYLYEHGEGVESNLERAFSWYREAAKRGNRLAEYQLGRFYYQGRGVAQDYKQAMNWFTLSAEKGHAKSMSFVGYLYEKGLGILVDYREARKWYLKGAEAGDSYSQEHIGHLLINGWGGDVDYDEANTWLQQAALGDREWAYYGIGLIHENTHQYSDAIRWYLLSAVKGYSYGFRRAVYLLVMYPLVALGLENQLPTLS